MCTRLFDHTQGALARLAIIIKECVFRDSIFIIVHFTSNFNSLVVYGKTDSNSINFSSNFNSLVKLKSACVWETDSNALCQ